MAHSTRSLFLAALLGSAVTLGSAALLVMGLLAGLALVAPPV